jgi:NADPH2:quinone reductase
MAVPNTDTTTGWNSMDATLPKTMRAVEITSYGEPEVLKAAERPVPVAGKGEVLIAVKAAGINRPDCLQRRGRYPVPPGASDIPGLEVAGTIAALGEGVTGWKVGDAVCALLAGGGYAAYCNVPAEQCLPVPRGYTMVQAASLPETFFTVWSMVWGRGRLAEGETLLVHGGSSGIGVTAIQMARALGHTVYVTAGTDDKCRACEALGADKAINYKTQDYAKEAKALTNGRGVDVILDMVAGEYVKRDIEALADDGRIVILALLGGAKGEVPFDPILRRRLTITGGTLRPRPVAFKGQVARDLKARIWPLLEAGKIKPVIHATFALEDAAKAHALMESGAHIGKIVLEVSAG